MDNNSIKLIPVECPKCGGQMQIEKKREEAFCPYCGSKIIIADNNKNRITINNISNHQEQININNITNNNTTNVYNKKKGIVHSIVDFGAQGIKASTEIQKTLLESEAARASIEAENMKDPEYRAYKERTTIRSLIASLLLMIIGIAGCTIWTTNIVKSVDDNGYIRVPRLKIYDTYATDAVKAYRKEGFTNIYGEYDTSFFLHSDGDIKEIVIDGKKITSSDIGYYDPNGEVIIRYYAEPIVSVVNKELEDLGIPITGK